jgi:hypothetical protein
MMFEMRNSTIIFSHPEMAVFLEDEEEMTKSAQPVSVAANVSWVALNFGIYHESLYTISGKLY